MRPVALAALLASLVPSLAAAVELHVPGAFPNVAAALDAVAAGDEIVLAAGVFPLATERDRATVLLLTNSTVVLRAFTVRNGEDGVNVSEGSAVLEDVRFTDNVFGALAWRRTRSSGGFT